MTFWQAIIIGALAGWISGKFVKKHREGCLWNIAIGITGSLLGRWIFSFLEIYPGRGFFSQLLTATLGSIAFLWIWNQVRK